MAMAKRQRTTTRGVLGGLTEVVHWRIPDFFSIVEEDLGADGFVDSPFFWYAGCTWHLRAYPKGKLLSGYLSVFLHKRNPNTAAKTLSTIAIGIWTLNGIAQEHTTTQGRLTFDKSGSYYGWTHFLKLDYLQNNKRLLLLSDSLTIRCRMEHPEEVVPEVDSNRTMLMGMVTLSSDLEQLLASDKTSDVIVNVQGREFRAHRALLQARSPVFRAMFEHDTAEAKTGVLTIPDCDPESFGQFLSFLYTGKLETVSPLSANHLYVTAEKYDVQQLKSVCADCLSQNLTPDNFCDVAALADRFCDEGLQSSAQDFFNQNWFRIVLTSPWKDMLRDEPRIVDLFFTNMASAARKEFSAPNIQSTVSSMNPLPLVVQKK